MMILPAPPWPIISDLTERIDPPGGRADIAEANV
jgi:hypothetical protein